MDYIINNFSPKSELWEFLLPFILMAVDILTGVIYAWISKTFESSKMRSGLGKKIGEGVAVFLGELSVKYIGFPSYVLDGIIIYISFMEMMSIFENLDKLGVPVPKKLKEVINNKSAGDDLAETLINKEDKSK